MKKFLASLVVLFTVSAFAMTLNERFPYIYLWDDGTCVKASKVQLEAQSLISEGCTIKGYLNENRVLVLDCSKTPDLMAEVYFMTKPEITEWLNVQRAR